MTMKDVIGAYRIQIYEGDSLVRDTGEFKNLITDYALTLGNPFSSGYLAIGAGSVPDPDTGDTNLHNEIAAISATFDSTGVIVMESGKRYSRRSIQASFSGVAGDVSEVGLRKANENTLVSRSLIRDGNGLATVVPIETQQTLKLTYSIYVLIPDVLAEGMVETPYGSSRFWIKPHPNLNSPRGILAGFFNQPYSAKNLSAIVSGQSPIQSTTFAWTYDTEKREATGVANFEAVDSNRTITGFESAEHPESLPIIELETPILNPARNDIDFALTFSWGRE